MTMQKATQKGELPQTVEVKGLGKLGIAAGRMKDEQPERYVQNLHFTKPELGIADTNIPANCLVFRGGFEQQTFCVGNMASGWRIGTQLTKVDENGVVLGYQCLVTFGGGSIFVITPDELSYGNSL